MIKVTREKLMDIYANVADLVLRKNADYNDAWQQDGVIGLTVRIKDKLNRIESLAGGREALVADEKIEDTARDLIGYAALLLIKLNEDKEKIHLQEMADAAAMKIIEDMKRGN